MKIAVLAGGASLERNVSLLSGAMVARALRSLGYEVVLIDSLMGFPDATPVFTADDVDSIPVMPETLPDLAGILSSSDGRRVGEIGPGVIDALREADITFNALHGGRGENGELQAFLDGLEIRYTGDGFLASTFAMNKDVARLLFAQAGVPVAPGRVFESASAGSFEWTYGFPCIVKPADSGSSVGIVKADNEEQLRSTLAAIAADGQASKGRYLIERFLPGREFAVGVLGTTALPVIEITPNEGLYDYTNKYQAGRTREICPAPISATETELLQELARKACAALRVEICARGEFILDESGHAWCLEMNTLPGMTPTSLLPQEAQAAGISFPELCERILRLSLKKYEN